MVLNMGGVCMGARIAHPNAWAGRVKTCARAGKNPRDPVLGRGCPLTICGGLAYLIARVSIPRNPRAYGRAIEESSCAHPLHDYAEVIHDDTEFIHTAILCDVIHDTYATLAYVDEVA